MPETQPTNWRRARRGPGIWLAALIVLGFIGVHTAWGRDATAATPGDCVYTRQQGWHLEPCALPVPWHDTANYKVLQRFEGTSTGCDTTSSWAPGDNTTVLPGTPPVTLCLAPVR
jgi:hypothetical protein